MENKKEEIKQEELDLPIGKSHPGYRFYYKVNYKYDENAKCHVPYFDKPVDMWQMIQASKASVDITTIVKRATLGDLTVLHLGEKPYGDISDIPDNLNDLNQFNKQAINDFIGLDPSIRNLFDNDVSKFAKAVEDGSYVDVIKKALNPKVEEKKEEGENNAI